MNNSRPSEEQLTRFDCSDRIHLVVVATGLSQETHSLKVRWIDPHGEQKQVTKYDFQGLPITQVWAWLQLHGPTGAIIGQMFDPSFGLEAFIGDWEAIVFIDDKEVSHQKFQVLC